LKIRCWFCGPGLDNFKFKECLINAFNVGGGGGWGDDIGGPGKNTDVGATEREKSTISFPGTHNALDIGGEGIGGPVKIWERVLGRGVYWGEDKNKPRNRPKRPMSQ